MIDETNEISSKKTALAEAITSTGAEFSSFNGWEMAASYGDTEAEINAVRHHVGLIDLTYNGVLKIGGKEAAQFLQGLVSNDVKALAKGDGMRAAFLTGHGKVRAFCLALGLGEQYLIVNEPQTHEKIYKYVFPFSYAGDFQVEDVSNDYRTLSVQGPQALLVMREVCFEPVPDLNEYQWIENVIAGQKVIVMRHNRTGESGFDIFVSTEGLKDVWDYLLLKGDFHLLRPVGLEALETLRIEAAIPVYGVDLDENNMLLESGVEDAVSFSKGCYTGQEAVAMATYRGHVSKMFVAILFEKETPIQVGDKISKDGKEIGTLTSIAHSRFLGRAIGLGCLKYGAFEDGTIVQLVYEGNAYSGEVLKSPLRISRKENT